MGMWPTIVQSKHNNRSYDCEILRYYSIRNQ